MKTTEQTRGPILLGENKRPANARPDASSIPNLEGRLRALQDDLNAVSGRKDEFDWNAEWVNNAISMLQIEHQHKRK